jgi:cell wall-associated NlpC family hydrolase
MRLRKFLLPATLLFVVLFSTPVYAETNNMLVNAVKGNTVVVKEKKVFQAQFVRIATQFRDKADASPIALDTPHAYYCSGFVQDVYRQNGIWIPAVSVVHQASFGQRVNKLAQVEPGDLVFFSAKTSDRIPSHVAIALGGGCFLHAAGPHKQISLIAVTPEIKQHFMFARRLITSV